MKRILNRFKTFDYKRMINMINVVKSRSNHSFLWILLDILRCAIKFGSGYMDYYLFYFEELTDEEKSTYINIAVNNKYIRDCNDFKYYYVLNDKTVFLKKYKDFIKRDFIDIRNASYEEYIKFVNKHQEFMAKPIDGLCGKGIELIKSEGNDLRKLYDSLKEKGQFLLEERIDQCDEINSIYPNSINTIRVVTLNKNDNVSILFTCIRIGNNGKVVDNFNNGGMFAPIDENGIISRVALDKDNVAYEHHPMTNTKIVGFKIPRFNEIIELCKNLAKVTPEIGLTGWDIAVAKEGLDVVEGNQIPGYDIYQSKEHIAPSRYGIKDRFDDAIYPANKDKKIFAKGYNFIKYIWVILIAVLIDVVNLFVFNKISNLFIYLTMAYILYKHIDIRPLYKTVLYSCIFGFILLILAILDCVFIKGCDSSLILFNNFVYFFTPSIAFNFIKFIIYSILYTIFFDYFIFPLLDKLIEKMHLTLGVVLTIIAFIVDFVLILFFIYIMILVSAL